MTKLGPKFYVSTWDEIRGHLDPKQYDANWENAIAGIEGRFLERFVKPADAIQALDSLDNKDEALYPEGRGFALVAIDCLLLESLYGYERGKRTKSSRATSEAFEAILTRPPFKDAFEQEDRAKTFGASIRNGLLHDGETRDRWLIWKGERHGHRERTCPPALGSPRRHLRQGES